MPYGSRSTSRHRSHSDLRNSRLYGRSRSRSLSSSSYEMPYRRGGRDYRDYSPRMRSHYIPTPTYAERENPPPSKCLGIFGLDVRTTERDLRDIFSDCKGFKDVTLVYDRANGRSRGFAFLQFHSTSDAGLAKKECSGMKIDDRPVRLDFSLTHRAHKPTPGVYMGRPTIIRPERYRDDRYHRRDYDDRRYRERDYDYYPSHRRDYYSRSRSRSPYSRTGF